MTSPLWPMPENALPFNDVADNIKRREYTEQVATKVTENGAVLISNIPEVKPEDMRLFTKPRRRGTNDAGPL